MTVEEADGPTFGVSWSLSKKTAEFFRDQYIRNYETAHLEKTMVEKIVRKNSTLAYFALEEEIIYIDRPPPKVFSSNSQRFFKKKL